MQESEIKEYKNLIEDIEFLSENFNSALEHMKSEAGRELMSEFNTQIASHLNRLKVAALLSLTEV